MLFSAFAGVAKDAEGRLNTATAFVHGPTCEKALFVVLAQLKCAVGEPPLYAKVGAQREFVARAAWPDDRDPFGA